MLTPNNPPIGFTTLPPKALVKTWVSLAKDESSEMAHAHKRAVDVIKLVFGSVHTAEAYLNSQES